MGFSDFQPLLGRSRPIRSDDFFVATPLIRSAVVNGFQPIEQFSPYHESLKSFIALPLKDWGLVLKPQFWGFFALPPPQAISLYFLSFYLSFLFGYTLLLRRLGATPALAFIVTVTLMFAQLPQVWWTQRAPAYALAPWAFLLFLSQWRWYIRLPLLAYATAVWVLSDLYPPTLISAGFGLGVLVLAFGRDKDAFAPARLIGSVAAAAAGVGLVVLYLGDIIPIMMNTVYPGQRSTDGGGLPPLMLLAHLFPHVASVGYQPSLRTLNPCEVGVVGTFLPLIVLVFGDWTSMAEWWRANRTSALLWVAGLALMLAWMVLPIPAQVGQVLLWDRVPAIRMLWGFGALLTLGLAVIASQIRFSFTSTRLGLFAALVIAAWLASKVFWIEPGSEAAAFSTRVALAKSSIDLVILVPLGLLALVLWRSPARVEGQIGSLLALAAMTHVLIAFGGFNPLQSGYAIFRKDTSPRLEAIKAIAAHNPHGWAAVFGGSGHALQAFGVPAFNNVLPKPELAFFRKLYPDMPDAQFNALFNRYAHIALMFVGKPSNPQNDLLNLPIFDFGTPMPVAPVADRTLGITEGPQGHVDGIEVEPAGPGLQRVIAHGWAPLRGIDPAQTLGASFGGAEIVSLRAVRLDRADVGANFKDPAYNTSGFALEAIVRADDAAHVKADTTVFATDESGRLHRLPGPE